MDYTTGIVLCLFLHCQPNSCLGFVVVPFQDNLNSAYDQEEMGKKNNICHLRNFFCENFQSLTFTLLFNAV